MVLLPALDGRGPLQFGSLANRVDLCLLEVDLFGALRNLGNKQIICELRRGIPFVEKGGELRLSRVFRERDDQFSRQRFVAGLDPDLPVEAVLSECEMMARSSRSISMKNYRI